MANNLYKADLAAMSGLKEAQISLKGFARKLGKCLDFIYEERERLASNYRDFICAESPATFSEKRDAELEFSVRAKNIEDAAKILELAMQDVRKLNYDIAQLFNELVPSYWNIPRLENGRLKK